MGPSACRLPILLALAALAVGCGPPRPSWVRPDARPAANGDDGRPSPIEPSAEGGGGDRIHVVRPGETLYRIAREHGVDPDELADLNEIANASHLAVGRELALPRPKGRRVASAAAAPRRSAAPSPAKAEPRIDRGPRPERSLSWPVRGVLNGRFGLRNGNPHDGIDIAAPEGTPILASEDGVVLFAGNQRGYGNIVILRHASGLVTVYAHNERNLVRDGDRVKVGEEIARVGRTGRASGPHCHFEVREGTRPRDPQLFLPR